MCFLEVDLAYPDEVACYPLAKEKIEVRKEMLSDYQLQFTEENNFSYDKNKKPISNLGDQIKYKLHYQNLRVYLSFGLELKKIIEHSNKNQFYQVIRTILSQLIYFFFQKKFCVHKNTQKQTLTNKTQLSKH